MFTRDERMLLVLTHFCVAYIAPLQWPASAGDSGAFDGHVASSLDQLPDTKPKPSSGDPHGEKEDENISHVPVTNSIEAPQPSRLDPSTHRGSFQLQSPCLLGATFWR